MTVLLKQIGRPVALGAIAAATVLVAAACGSSSTPSSSPSSSSSGSTTSSAAVPTQSFSSHPAISSTGYGLGDTSGNPDQSYECAAQLTDDSGSVIAYSTVAGTDNAEATQFCAALESDSSWTSVKSISAGSYETTPTCHLTTTDTKTTARIYTAKPDGDDSATTQLCAALAQGFGAG